MLTYRLPLCLVAVALGMGIGSLSAPRKWMVRSWITSRTCLIQSCLFSMHEAWGCIEDNKTLMNLNLHNRHKYQLDLSEFKLSQKLFTYLMCSCSYYAHKKAFLIFYQNIIALLLNVLSLRSQPPTKCQWNSINDSINSQRMKSIPILVFHFFRLQKLNRWKRCLITVSRLKLWTWVYPFCIHVSIYTW